MAVEDTIKCPSCGRAIVPRLNVYDATPINFGRVEHRCSLCGAVIFETGGEVRWRMVIFLLVTVGGCALVVVLGAILSGR